MALFDQTLAHTILGQIRQHYAELGTALGEPASAGATDPFDLEQSIYPDLLLLIEVANGLHLRSDALVAEVEQALKRLIGLLLGNVLHAQASFPPDFWGTDTGILVSRARWWVSAEDLITISNAAALAFGENNQANRLRIARAMDSGALDWVPDPSVVNPQQNRRVLRSQVERLRALRRLPE
jgi:hypothetical protein